MFIRLALDSRELVSIPLPTDAIHDGLKTSPFLHQRLPYLSGSAAFRTRTHKIKQTLIAHTGSIVFLCGAQCERPAEGPTSADSGLSTGGTTSALLVQIVPAVQRVSDKWKEKTRLFLAGLSGRSRRSGSWQSDSHESNKDVQDVGGDGDDDEDIVLPVSIKPEDSRLMAKRKQHRFSGGFVKGEGGSRSSSSRIVLPSVGWQPPEGSAAVAATAESLAACCAERSVGSMTVDTFSTVDIERQELEGSWLISHLDAAPLSHEC